MTSYRAREIFQIESAVLVTQDFHLPRALFTYPPIGGTDAVGVSPEILRPYRGARCMLCGKQGRYLCRLWDTLRQERPVLGEPIPLFD